MQTHALNSPKARKLRGPADKHRFKRVSVKIGASCPELASAQGQGQTTNQKEDKQHDKRPHIIIAENKPGFVHESCMGWWCLGLASFSYRPACLGI